MTSNNEKNQMIFNYEHAFNYNKAIRDLIMHENALTNQRMGWMLALQTLLFGAFGYLWGKPDEGLPITFEGLPITLIIALVGLLSSISFGYILHFSMRAIDKLNEKYKAFEEKYAKEFELPPIMGLKPYESQDKDNSKLVKLRWLFPWTFMPFVIAFAWIGMVLLWITMVLSWLSTNC